MCVCVCVGGCGCMCVHPQSDLKGINTCKKIVF